MKKLSLIAGGVAGFGLALLLATQGQSFAADHLDSATTLGPQPMADINDVYVWTTSDTTPDANTGKVNLVMTVSPGDPGSRVFSDAVQYVFHVVSRPGATPSEVVAMPGGVETKVVCTFTSNTAVQCWVVSGTTVKDYASGDPSAATGLRSSLGKFKVFAGRRSDPFFFNLQGFRNAVATIGSIAGSLTFDAAGCPNNLLDAQAAAVRNTLSTLQTTGTGTPACSTTEIDCFKTFNVMAIVVQVDKNLLNSGSNTMFGVWGSTHMKP